MGHGARALELRLHLAAARSECLVHGLSGTEQVSRPFRYEIDFVAEDVDLDAARASELLLEIGDTDGRERFVHGVIEEISVSPTAWEDRNHYRAVVVPEAALLRYRHGFRLFQALAVPDICRRVLERAGLAEERFEWRLSASYAPRELCIQYDESEWDFISRLCEAEGIWYRFEHRADGHTMIFGDHSASAPRMDPDPLAFAFTHGDSLGAHAYALHESLDSVEDRVALDDYDRLRPNRELSARAGTDPILEREWYEYPGGYGDEATGRRLAQARLDALRSRHHTIELGTTAFGAIAGMRAVIAGAPIDVPDAFIIESSLAIGPVEDAPDEGGWRVGNTLTLIPEAQPFRPARHTPVPRIIGLQTARVTGPAGQEIHIDEYGRVKLQFHWDRDGQLDEHTSSWVPVAQGHTTGAIMHPRIGWEVIVEFREGNPDRPVVVGRVYNPFFPPPHALPERKTLTAHRSDTLPGREKINEVRFEDLAGQEHIAITAGHDLREVTVVNRHVTVHRHENREVGAHRAELVGVLQKTVGRRNHSDSVSRTQNVFVGKDRVTLVRKSASEQIAQDLEHLVGNLAFAQVGESVRGRLQSMLRQSEEGPAHVVLESLERLLEQAREAAGGEAGEAGSAQQLLESNDPSPAYVLGPVLGGLTQAPESPPDHSSTLGTSLGDTMGEAGREIGEVVEGVVEVVDGVGEIAKGVEKLADGVESPDEAMDAIGDIAGGLVGVNEGVGDVAGGLEGLGGAIDDASVMQEEGWLSDIAGFMGELGEVSGEVQGASDQVLEVTKAVGEAAALAEAATELIDDPNVDGVLGVLRAVSSAERPDRENEEERVSHEESREQPKKNELAWLDGVMGAEATQTAWDVAGPIVQNLDSMIAGISGIIDAGVALLDGGGGEHPYEHNAVHFAAAVANALVRGRLSEEEEGEEEEEDEGEQESGGESSASEPADSDDDGESSEDEDEPDHPEQGEGTWSFIVGGNDRLNIAGALVLGSGKGMRVGVGGASTEMTRLARIEQVGENRLEQTDGGKTESTGRYAVVAGEGVSIASGGTARCVVNGDAAITVAGAQTIEAGSQLQLQGQNLLLDGAETVVFECGAARVSVSSDGISIEGTEIVVRGNVIGVDAPALG